MNESKSPQFELLPLRFIFVAREHIYFTEGTAANFLRGAFGTIFRKIACAPHCPGARQCPVRVTCPYARIFEPSALMGGPSGLMDRPRPFVLRAAHLDGKTITPESTFFFDVHLFDTRSNAIGWLTEAFGELANEGIGRNRARAELISVWRVDEDGCTQPLPTEPLIIDLAPGEQRVDHVRVKFVTPTELKIQQTLVREPSFGVLAARIRDRVSTLRELYGEGPLEIDFRSYGKRAKQITMSRCELTQVTVDRRSSRTRQVHSIGGFVGIAEYKGELSEFIPYLRAAKWTGVGRQTVWGKGEIHYSELTSGHRSVDK